MPRKGKGKGFKGVASWKKGKDNPNVVHIAPDGDGTAAQAVASVAELGDLPDDPGIVDSDCSSQASQESVEKTTDLSNSTLN